MFISSLTLRNILSFRDPSSLELRSLNILIGANASGKSNLINSEEQMPASPAKLCSRHGIDPGLVANVFWMVELMESWLLADPDALAKYYGQNFSVNAIGKTKDVERIPKSDVLSRLKRATQNRYHKVTHAPHLPALLNPDRVQERASHCRKLFDTVRARLQGS